MSLYNLHYSQSQRYCHSQALAYSLGFSIAHYNQGLDIHAKTYKEEPSTSFKLSSSYYFIRRQTSQMAPNELQQLVYQFVSDMRECHRLCLDIRRLRNVGSTNALDRLELAFERAATSIVGNYNSKRESNGARMDLGDHEIHEEMEECIGLLEIEIKTKLSVIARPPEYQPRLPGMQQWPGFAESLSELRTIEQRVLGALDRYESRLTRRVRFSPWVTDQPREEARRSRYRDDYYGLGQQDRLSPSSQNSSSRLRSDEVIVPLDVFNSMKDHMKNSWYEKTSSSGRVKYINVYDESNQRSDKPSRAYIMRK